MPIPAVVLAAGIAGGAAIAASNTAATAQRDAAKWGIQAQKDAYADAKSMTAPYRTAGVGAMGKLGKLFAFDPTTGEATNEAPDYSGFNNSPGFNFARDLGSQAINRNAASQGGLYSPTTMAKLSEYNIGFASQQYQDYVKNLMGMAQLGGNAATGTGNQAVETGQGVAQSLTNAGDATADNATSTAGVIGGLASNQNFVGALASMAGGNNKSGVNPRGMADMTPKASPWLMNSGLGKQLFAVR